MKKVKIEETRTYGIEIECFVPISRDELAHKMAAKGIDSQSENWNHYTRNYWKLTTDSSIKNVPRGYTGVEIVSPPIKGQDGMKQLKMVCELLDEVGAKVNRTCGLHVHHDARDIDLPAWKIILKAYIKYENIIDGLMPNSRRGNNNQYCKSLINSYVGAKEMFKKINRARTLYDLRGIWNHDRYRKVNLQSYQRHGTVEFRQHSGTIKFDKIAYWVAFTQGIINRAVAHKNVTLKPTDKPFESLMYTVQANAAVAKFYRARAEELAA